MKVLCYVNHFFGPGVSFQGKSTDKQNTCRKATVDRCLAQLHKLGQSEVRVCGLREFALVPVDVDFPQIRATPTFLIYESLCHMAQHVDDYDYFINVEDDIFVPEETLVNTAEFDRTSLPNEVLHPNRLEQDESGRRYCVDLELNRRWTYQHRRHNGRELRVAMNPHSAILLLSREKLRYALQNIDRAYRGVFLAHAMESAFAHFLSPFCLYRPYGDLDFHYVIHLDRWIGSDALVRQPSTSEPPWRHRAKGLAKDWLPPIAVRTWKRLRGD